MLLGDAAYVLRDQIDAFCQHHRRTHFLRVVLERHREVRGIDEHDIGRGHLVHHAAARQRLLHLADALFRLRTAVRFLGFVAQFLARHAQHAFELKQLQRHVDHGHQHQRARQPDE